METNTMIYFPVRLKYCRMAPIIVPLRVLGDNILIKMTSEGVYDVWCAWCASLSLIRRKILSPQPQGFFYSFDKSPNLQDWSCPSLSGVLYRPLELEAKPAFRCMEIPNWGRTPLPHFLLPNAFPPHPFLPHPSLFTAPCLSPPPSLFTSPCLSPSSFFTAHACLPPPTFYCAMPLSKDWAPSSLCYSKLEFFVLCWRARSLEIYVEPKIWSRKFIV